MRNLQQFWTQRRIGEDRQVLARLGPLRIWLARAEKEWAFAHEQAEAGNLMDVAQVPEEVLPENLKWSKVLFREAPRDYGFQAAVPNRPIYVEAREPMVLPSGEGATFFVSIPAVVEVWFGQGKQRLKAGQMNSLELGDAWFGSPTEGELCYAIPHPAERDLDDLKVHPNEIVCPVEIMNRSSEALVFEKMCLRPAYLTLYSGMQHLWAGLVRIQNEHLFQRSMIRYSAEAPGFESNLTKIAEARMHADRGLSRLSFRTRFQGDIQFGDR
jgi:hypothetical protein